MTVEPVPTAPVLDRDPLPSLSPPPVAPAAHLVDPPHRHTRSCYWDFRVAAWVCP